MKNKGLVGHSECGVRLHTANTHTDLTKLTVACVESVWCVRWLFARVLLACLPVDGVELASWKLVGMERL